jgi:hypothetical protein
VKQEKEGAGHEIYFIVEEAPELLHLLEEDIKAYHETSDKIVVNLKVTPAFGGWDLLWEQDSLVIPFEVGLRGFTSKLGRFDGHKNIRLIGRFLVPENILYRFVDPSVQDKLMKWQWEVVFSPRDRQGMIFKLDCPLPEVLLF